MKPVLIKPSLCDAAKDMTFTFTAKTIISAAEIVVYTNDTAFTKVYEGKTQTAGTSITIPAASGLENGKYYVARLYVYDLSGQKSEPSSYVDFECYSTPELSVNLTDGQIVGNSSYIVQLSYSQEQGDQLSVYGGTITDANGKAVFETGRLYAYNTMNFMIYGLENEHEYVLHITGETVAGMPVTVQPVSFSVKYGRAVVYNLLDVSHDACAGITYIDSKIDVVTGETGEKEPVFIDGEKVDLTQEGAYVKFPSGFRLEEDFTIKVLGQDFSEGKTILELVSETGQRHVLRYLKGTFEQFENEPRAYVEYVVFSGMETVTLSNYIAPPQKGQKLHIWLRRKNGFYTVKLAEVA